MPNKSFKDVHCKYVNKNNKEEEKVARQNFTEA